MKTSRCKSFLWNDNYSGSRKFRDSSIHATSKHLVSTKCRLCSADVYTAANQRGIKSTSLEYTCHILNAITEGKAEKIRQFYFSFFVFINLVTYIPTKYINLMCIALLIFVQYIIYVYPDQNIRGDILG